MPVLPKQLVVIGDSSVYGWGDTEGGGWCERLRKDWSKIQNAPIIYQLGVRGDGIEKVSFRWEKEWSSRGETRRNKPKAILLNVGLNDTPTIGQKNGRHQLEINGFEYGLERLIFEMKSQTKVFVILMKGEWKKYVLIKMFHSFQLLEKCTPTLEVKIGSQMMEFT